MNGRVVHFEIPIDQPQRAGEFYRKVFGWNVAKWEPAEYWTVSAGGGDGYGAEGALKPRAQGPEGITVYIATENIDNTMERIKESGGTVLTAKMPVPSLGWSAQFRDTEGNLIGLFQNDPTVPAPEGWPKREEHGTEHEA